MEMPGYLNPKSEPSTEDCVQSYSGILLFRGSNFKLFSGDINHIGLHCITS